MSGGDEGQPGLQEANKDIVKNETPNNIEYFLHKNLEYLLAQQQDAMLKQQQMFLTIQSVLINSQRTHSTKSSGPSRQGTNDLSTGFSGSCRQGTSSTSHNKNQDKRHHNQAGDERKHPSDDENCDDDDQLSVTVGHDFDVIVVMMKVETEIKKIVSPDTFEKLKSISPQLH